MRRPGCQTHSEVESEVWPGEMSTTTYRLNGDKLSSQPGLDAQGLNGTSRRLPSGAYTTFRTYNANRVLCLDVHLDRLETSARLLGFPLSVDRLLLRRGLSRVLLRHAYSESRLRVTLALPAGDVFITIEPFTPLAETVYHSGVRAVTRTMHRHLPRAKNTDFIVPSREMKHALPPDVFEVFMCASSGEISEGFTSNFFAVKGGVLYTAGAGVLEGITRRIVLDIAPRVIPVHLKPIHRQELGRLEEAFLTSSSRELVPVVEIDGQPIGIGRPGPVTSRLLHRYRAFVRRVAQPLSDD